MNLRAAGDPADLFQDLEGPLVLVADELTPSVIAQLDWQRLAALVTDAGSWTYHTAILARSIRVPAVAGLRNASSDRSRPARWSRSTALTGEVIVDPDAETLAQVQARRQRRQAYERRSTSSASCRRSPRTASRSGSRPTSRRRTMPRARASAARKASACSDRSSCSPAAGRRR